MRKRAIKIFPLCYRLLATTNDDDHDDDDDDEARRRGLRVATPIVFGFHFAQVCVIINPEMEVNVESIERTTLVAAGAVFLSRRFRRRLSLFFLHDKKEAWRTLLVCERFRGLNY